MLATVLAARPAQAATTFNWADQSPANIPAARCGAAMAYDSVHGQTVLFGGSSRLFPNGAFSDTWVWDGSNWTQLFPANSPPARTLHVMSFDSVHGQVVLFGGIDGSFNYLSDTWVWNGTNWTQEFPAKSPPAGINSMAYDSAQGQTVLFNGASTWVWNGTTWTQLSPANSPAVGFGEGFRNSAMAYDSARGQIVLTVYSSSGTFATWVWNGTNWMQMSPANSPPARMDQTMAYQAAYGYTVLFGGTPGAGGNALSDTWVWDGTNWTQEFPATVPTAQGDAAMAYDPAHAQVVMFGGLADTNTSPFFAALSDTTLWGAALVSTWSQALPASSPPARYGHTMAYDAAQQQVVLFGGAGSTGLLSDTWGWNGANWTQLSPVNSPPPRSFSAMAYDSTHAQIVLFGGSGSQGALGDTWVWNGTNWSQLSPAASPPARYAAAMAYDSVHGQTVLFGGLNGSLQGYGDTWVWDGTNWTQEFPAMSPPASVEGSTLFWAAAFDTARGQTVLAGGDGQEIQEETWLWDGTNWTQATVGNPSYPGPYSPPHVQYPGVAYESVHELVVFFGGLGFTPPFPAQPSGATWSWDGVLWTPQSPIDSPPARYAQAIAFDAEQGQVVMFGGCTAPAPCSTPPLSDTWTLLFTVPPPPAATITSSPSGAAITVAGGGCAPEGYTTPTALTWSTGSVCTISFTDPQTISGVEYEFQSSTVNGSAVSHSNPLTVTYSGGSTSIDAVFSAVSGTGPGTATHLSVTAPASATAGIPIQFTVTALNASNQTVTSYTDPVHFTSTDPLATLPGNAALINGVGTFSASLVTPGSISLTASDLLSPGIGGTSGSIAVSQPASGLLFISMPPCRVVDTRDDTKPSGFGPPSLAGGATRSFAIPNGPCGIPATAQAYSMNVTVVPDGPLSYLTVWPTGQSQPFVSTLNSLDGKDQANAAIVPGGTGGAISVFATNNTNLVLDINGYFVPNTVSNGLGFYPMTPCRLVDTRPGAPSTILTGALAAGISTTLPILSSSCNVPAAAQAYSLNFTLVPTEPVSYLTVYPTGESLPIVSTMNDPTGTIEANAAITPAGSGGDISVYVTQTTNLVVDINGYFAPVGAGALFLYALPPCRVLDTRDPTGSPPFQGAINVNVIGTGCGGTNAAQAYVFNATVVPDGALGYLTLWPEGNVQPVVSTLNAINGDITSNMAIVPTSNTQISAFADGTTFLVLDLFGYFAP